MILGLDAASPGTATVGGRPYATQPAPLRAVGALLDAGAVLPGRTARHHLLGDPPVLVFDEPLNGLAPEGIVWIRGLMRRMAAEGRAVLMSSHLMSDRGRTGHHRPPRSGAAGPLVGARRHGRVCRGPADRGVHRLPPTRRVTGREAGVRTIGRGRDG